MSTVRAVSWFNSDLRIGVAVTAVGVIAVLLTAIVYINPMGRKTVSFETTDVSAISTGQDVRIAGISIGKVAKMHLGDQVVRVDLEVKDDAFIGDDSRVDVRMLTPVGGYAITIIPLGSEEASGLVIPSNHVSVPYSIGDVLQATPKVTDEVDAATVDANLSQVAEALGSNPGSIGVCHFRNHINRPSDGQATRPSSHHHDAVVGVPLVLQRQPRSHLQPRP
ncbi:virulence factor Mce-like protein [Rhodococcus erythropolis]|uniref:MlaD family protein n=1 Tax=Rhodococcus erythropolis TaxID=1833 RepID=UPI0022245516|nr:MlaD family protein [Rhodococcus erythropolis]MCW2425525.1 virulence factor Mce-like protein [Rhodococcus erythropolis]